jgi:hypothetical protein
VTISTTSTPANGTRVFDGVALLSKVRYEVFSITGRKPRFEIYVGGTLEKSIPATRRWQAEQREAIQWCQQELGWKVDDGKTNRAQVAPRASQPRPVSALRITQMATLYANILADRGRLESPEDLLKVGHTCRGVGGTGQQGLHRGDEPPARRAQRAGNPLVH